MKTPIMLLLTNDPLLEDSVADALFDRGGISHLTHSADDALQIVRGVGANLDFAVIDFESGPHGIALLGAIHRCREHLPVIAVTDDDDQYIEALAYANGAVACLPKRAPLNQLTAAINKCCPHPCHPACHQRELVV